ncbi:MAG: sulfatase [Deltaproteobacteria bacterium]|nr:sulfatase [Deltaproteobacteria bacterium]
MSALAAPMRPALADAGLVAWIAAGCVNAAVIAGGWQEPAAGASLRAAHHFYDAAYSFGLGALWWCGLAAWQRWAGRRYRSLAPAALAVLWGALALALLPGDLSGLAEKLPDVGRARWRLAVLVDGAVVLALVLSLVPRMGRRTRFVWAGAGLALLVGNHLVLENDYEGLHAFGGLVAGALLTRGLAPFAAEIAGRLVRPARIGMLALAGLPAVAAAALPPSARTWTALTDTASSPAVTLVVLFRSLVAEARGAQRAAGEWYRSRAGRPDVAPSSPPLLGHDPVVLLLTIEALRADVLATDKHEARLPNLTALARMGVHFTQARTTAPQTLVSMAGLFASRYYSQLYWTTKSGWSTDRVFPHEDRTPRFPELLARAGVRTVLVASQVELLEEYGAARGFTEVNNVRMSAGHVPTARELGAPIVARLLAHEGGPLFLYTHFMDSHSPYKGVAKRGKPFDRYLRALARVDAQIGKIWAALRERGLEGRTVLMVTGDHGEAFGEHGRKFHATTLYEELVRVPLVVVCPGLAPRKVGEPVSLVDIAPTVLDLFGRPTPGLFMGQSLVPFLRGQDPRLARPIALESGRHLQALVLRDGTKLIRNRKKLTEEIYDLSRDPAESRNLIDSLGPEGKRKMGLLAAFFAAHAYKRPGYEAPYRR